MGSLTAMRPSSPTRLQEAGNQALVAEFAQRDAAELVLAIISARTPGQLATVANAGGRRVARHFRKLQRGRKALFPRLLLVHHDRFQARPPW